MSSFTRATWEPVMLPNGKQKTREGRKVYAIRGEAGNGFWFYIGTPDSGLGFHVEEGFETDELSLPTLKSNGLLKLAGLFSWVVPQKAREKAVKSSAVHDKARTIPWLSTADADGLFWIAMSAEGTPESWRYIFFNAVITNGDKK